jgi:hypothetical protein
VNWSEVSITAEMVMGVVWVMLVVGALVGGWLAGLWWRDDAYPPLCRRCKAVMSQHHRWRYWVCGWCGGTRQL